MMDLEVDLGVGMFFRDSSSSFKTVDGPRRVVTVLWFRRFVLDGFEGGNRTTYRIILGTLRGAHKSLTEIFVQLR